MIVKKESNLQASQVLRRNPRCRSGVLAIVGAVHQSWIVSAFRAPTTNFASPKSEEIVQQSSAAITRPRQNLTTPPPSHITHNGCFKAPPTGLPPRLGFAASARLPTSFPRRSHHTVNCKERICVGPEGDDCARGAQRGYGRGDGAKREGLRSRRGSRAIQRSVRAHHHHYKQEGCDMSAIRKRRIQLGKEHVAGHAQ